jgi:Rrf2 family protein
MFRTKGLANAILTACELAGKDKGTTAAVIASKYDLPPTYAAKIMGQLARARVFQSYRGPTGGYTLERPANKTTLLEIFESVNGPLGDGSIHGLSGSLGKRVQVAIGNANDAIRRVLGGTTLAALTKK